MHPRIGVFPGSFDPLTVGHVDIIQRAAPLFDKLIVAIGINASKQYFFSLEQRIAFISNTFADIPTISVETYSGLTVDFCQRSHASHIVRGLRSVTDLEFERNIAHLNHHLLPTIDTVFLLCSPQYSHISSTIVREILTYQGNVVGLVPEAVLSAQAGTKKQ